MWPQEIEGGLINNKDKIFQKLGRKKKKTGLSQNYSD